MESTVTNRNRRFNILLLAIVIFTLSIAGVSYAYFQSQVIGNEEASSIFVTTSDTLLRYTDVQVLTDDDIEPGWSQTKTLTVENIGDERAYYRLMWRDLINEKTNDEMLISATCTATSGVCPDIDDTVIPTALTEAHNITVKSYIPISPGVTHTYTVTVKFKETGSNQNYNQDKIFSGTLNIGDGEPLQYIAGTSNPREVRIGNEEFYVLNDIPGYLSFIQTNQYISDLYNYESGKLMLLAKYNLNVGIDSSGVELTASAPYYGLQKEGTKARVAFSATQYWTSDANSDVYPQYGASWYSSNIYDSSYDSAPVYILSSNNSVDETQSPNYSIAYYVKNYINRIGIEATGRLLTYDEARALGCGSYDCDSAPEWVRSSSYWIATAGEPGQYSHFIYRYLNSGNTLDWDSNYKMAASNYPGVRPLLVVDASDIREEPVIIRRGTDSDTGLPKVTIGTEEFLDITNAINYSSLVSTNGNLYNYDSSKSILLAKYNLYVGRIYNNGTYTEISSSANGYGLQSADAKGYVDSSTPRVGVVPYAGSSVANGYGYWYDETNDTIKSKYGTNYTKNNIYDSSLTSAPDWSAPFYNDSANANYSVAYYVEDYVNRLGVDGIGRLLTYTEAYAMTETQRINGAQYYVGSASSNLYMRAITLDGTIRSDNYNNLSAYGVRPVIVVNTADIEDPTIRRRGTDSDTGLPKVTIGSEEFLDITNAINYSSFDSTFLTKINYDVSKSILLAKYNLYVGQICTSSTSCTTISKTDRRYGLQSSEAMGNNGSAPFIGVVPFAGSSNGNGYWDPDGTGMLTKYGTYSGYNNNLYEPNNISAPDFSAGFGSDATNANYSIAYYVEEYVNRLGVNGIGRLLTHKEANALTQSQRPAGAYWLGTADSSSSTVRHMRAGGNLNHGSAWGIEHYGVHPVIVVNTADIQASR